MDALATLVVPTDNSVCQITILQAHTREVIALPEHVANDPDLKHDFWLTTASTAST